jgi:hypothetical protein
VPLPKVRGIAEEEMFKVVKTGKKTAKKGWKRMITKPTFVVSQIPIEKKATLFYVSSRDKSCLRSQRNAFHSMWDYGS